MDASLVLSALGCGLTTFTAIDRLREIVQGHGGRGDRVLHLDMLEAVKVLKGIGPEVRVWKKAHKCFQNCCERGQDFFAYMSEPDNVQLAEMRRKWHAKPLQGCIDDIEKEVLSDLAHVYEGKPDPEAAIRERYGAKHAELDLDPIIGPLVRGLNEARIGATRDLWKYKNSVTVLGESVSRADRGLSSFGRICEEATRMSESVWSVAGYADNVLQRSLDLMLALLASVPSD